MGAGRLGQPASQQALEQRGRPRRRGGEAGDGPQALGRGQALDGGQAQLKQIAAELGTSREVVSRILADFAAGGLLQITRGSITVLDRAALARRAT